MFPLAALFETPISRGRRKLPSTTHQQFLNQPYPKVPFRPFFKTFLVDAVRHEPSSGKVP